MRFFALLCVIRVAFAIPCIQVDGDRIAAIDIAPQAPGFGKLDPTIVIGFTPFPGSRRTFTRGQLIALAREHGVVLDGPAPDVCVERALAPLTIDRIRAAMQDSLGVSDVRIEIVDFLRQPAPSGPLDFPRSGLPPIAQADSPILWRGIVKYSPQHTFVIWATVRINKELPVVIATHAIRQGAAIEAGDIEVVTRGMFPFTPHVELPAEVLGRVARKNIPTGTPISNNLVVAPPDVARGDIVHVVVRQGSAQISFDALAQSAGRKGERVLLLNPQSLHTFRAVIDATGQAHIGDGS